MKFLPTKDKTSSQGSQNFIINASQKLNNYFSNEFPSKLFILHLSTAYRSVKASALNNIKKSDMRDRVRTQLWNEEKKRVKNSWKWKLITRSVEKETSVCEVESSPRNSRGYFTYTPVWTELKFCTLDSITLDTHQ